MGKNILITGASQGLGRELAKQLASDGHNIYLIARNVERLSEVKSEIEKHRGHYHYIKCDVSDFNQCKATFDIAKGEFGSIDIAILNAAVSENKKLSEKHLREVRKTMEINYFGIVNFSEILFPYFKAKGKGSFVGIGSLADARGFEGSGPYCASKSAVEKFLEAARTEMKRHGVDVFTIKPGFIETKMIEGNDYPMPFKMPPEKAAKKVIKAIYNKKTIYEFPWQTKVLSYLVKIIPNSLYNLLASFRKV